MTDHDTHVCRDCGAEITIPRPTFLAGYDLVAASQPPSGDAPDLRELVTELANELHGYGPVHDHHDPSDTTGWNVKGIETCGYPLCVAALAASAPSSPATPAPLEVEALERAWRDHILDNGPNGWPHMRVGSIPGDGPQPIEGCDDLCAGDILARAYANQEGGDCQHGIPRSECKLIEHTR